MHSLLIDMLSRLKRLGLPAKVLWLMAWVELRISVASKMLGSCFEELRDR